MSTPAPEPRAVSDVSGNKLPATRETFKSDAEYQSYNSRYNWEKAQNEKKSK